MRAIRIEPGEKVDLRKMPTQVQSDLSKEEAGQKLLALGQEMADLQELLFAAADHSLLIVLQGRDTSGKDGTIRQLLNHVNVQTTRVAPFKVPTPVELAHDFLWRVHAETPAKGGITIFNRSHYEDVLVVRVHDLVPKSVWETRYAAINEFEKLLAQNSTIVLKFMLHISKDEQEKRLLEREQEVEKAWKLSVGDWKEREHWDAYTDAYEAALSRCSAKHAPWYVVPADKKWQRDLMIFHEIVEALRPFREEWMRRLTEVGVKAKAELEAYRKGL